MITRFEDIRAQATSEHLAETPTIIIGDSLAAHASGFSFDLETTKKFVQENLSLPEDSLDHMLISLSRAKKDGMNRAGIHAMPHFYDGAQYFPVINIEVSTETGTPNTTSINKLFRHELRHLTHRARTPRYSRADVIANRRLGSILIGSYAVQSLAETNIIHSPVAFAGCAAVALYSIYSAEDPFWSSHSLSPDEWQANRFSRKHSYFQPFSFSPSP